MKFELFENHLVFIGLTILVFAPSCGKARLSNKDILWVGQTNGVDVVLKVKVLGCEQDSPVVVKAL